MLEARFSRVLSLYRIKSACHPDLCGSAVWQADLVAQAVTAGMMPGKTGSQKGSGVRRGHRRSPDQRHALSRVNWEAGPSCSGLYPSGAWTSPGAEVARPA